MSSKEEFMGRMRAKHDDLVKHLMSVPEAQMGETAAWGQRQMPIRTMFYQLINHEIEHTVHAVKTLRDLGIAQSEAEAILARLEEARGRLEGILVGLSDEDFDKAPEGEWSMRQVLEHIMETEDAYGSRLEQVIKDTAGG